MFAIVLQEVVGIDDQCKSLFESLERYETGQVGKVVVQKKSA